MISEETKALLKRAGNYSKLTIGQEQEKLKSNLFENHEIGLQLTARDAIVVGLFDLYVDFNIKSCKQWFYFSARLREESCKYSSGWSMEFSGPFIYTLLSDCKYLIDCYGQLNTIAIPHSQLPSYKESVFRPDKYDARYLTHYLQAIIRRDWALMNEIERQAREKLKKPHKSALYWFQVGGALQRSDKDEIIRVINCHIPSDHMVFC